MNEPIFPVSPEKAQALRERMQRWEVQERDLEERFVRSSGSGGQHINKVSTCVQLRHLPSGLEIKCRKSRSQGLNRYYARNLLLDKIETAELGRQSAVEQEREKIRRQKRKRSRRAKEKMLQRKKIRGELKQLRAAPAADE